MSLYTTIYWTKRTLLVLGLIIFACSGFRVFQFISKKLTKTDVSQQAQKPELAFGPTIDQVSITPLSELPSDFFPSEFRNTTRKGNLDTENGYPLESIKAPTANVYRILSRVIDIQTSEIPKSIAEKFALTNKQIMSTTTVFAWEDTDRRLEVNGQYGLIKYENKTLRQAPKAPSAASQLLTFKDSASIKSNFNQILKLYNISNSLDEYSFETTYLNFNTLTKTYEVATSADRSQFIRLSAKRNYARILKTNKEALSTAVYPNYYATNNYIILPSKLEKNSFGIDNIVEMSLYDWPLNQTVDKPNTEVSTYNIRTPKQAYDELVKNSNSYLVSATQWETNQAINLNELSGISRVEIFRIRMEYYEDTVNTNLIQPIYVYKCQARKGEKLYELIYYVPAVTNIN